MRQARAASGAPPGAFWRGQEHYHGFAGAVQAPGAGATAAMMASMEGMHGSMNQVQVTGDVNKDFVALMIPHHQAAADRARTYLETGQDATLLQPAQNIVASQAKEISQMQSIAPAPSAPAAHHH